jgi:uncharacterized protein YbbC (DUF1343 family)
MHCQIKQPFGLFLTFFLLLATASCTAVPEPTVQSNLNAERIIPGAERLNAYLPKLKNKRIAIAANHTSMLTSTHLVDTLRSLGVNVVCIFTPEHGFRGEADAGEKVSSSVDSKSGLPIFSLYGKKVKPDSSQLAQFDLLIYDIQDVGARFFTYTSFLRDLMEACAENNKECIVLDRPNPNIDITDGPVLQACCSSYVGSLKVPILYGMSIGELAQMIKGEAWINKATSLQLTVIPIANYTRQSIYVPPIPPSPNLKSYQAIRWYPNLCFFEATNISVGRGTPFPFEVVGGPKPTLGSFTFTPIAMPGAAKNPMHKDLVCYGLDLRELPAPVGLQWNILREMAAKSGGWDKMVTSQNFFYKLSGNETVLKLLKEGASDETIRASYVQELEAFIKLRSPYLIYPN